MSKRDIPRGEEVSLSYGIHHNNMTKDKRLVALKSGYKFDCTCEACKNDFPTLNNLDKSLTHGEIVWFPRFDLLMFNIRIIRTGLVLTGGKSLGKKLDKLLNQYQQSFTDGRLLDAKNACNKYLKTLSSCGVKYPHANYEVGAIALNSCWWQIISANQINLS